MSSQTVEFRTFYGTILREDFYKAKDNGTPAGIVIMTQGVCNLLPLLSARYELTFHRQLSLLKEHFIDDFARRFQEAGISALVYDHRGRGSSEGTPKYEINPIRQAEDYHDAITFASTLQPAGQQPRVAIWGIGHSGGGSMIAGNDPRLPAVVLVVPFTSGAADAAAFPKGILEKAWADREETTEAWAGGAQPNTRHEALWAESKENAEVKGPQNFLTGIDAYNFTTAARARSTKAGTPSNNKLSLQSFYHINNIEPVDYIHKISPRPLLYLAAVEDVLTGPLDGHRKVFEQAGEPKEFVVLNNHPIANCFGDSFEKNTSAQIEFLKKYL